MRQANAKDQAALAMLPWEIIGLAVFRGLSNFGQNYLTDYVGLRILNDIRDSMNRHLQFLSLSYFHRNPTGTLISRITNDVGLVRSALTDTKTRRPAGERKRESWGALPVPTRRSLAG